MELARAEVSSQTVQRETVTSHSRETLSSLQESPFRSKSFAERLNADTEDAQLAQPVASVQNEDRVISNCLLINHLSAVNSNRASGAGKWSFGSLMRSAANQASTGIDPAKFVRRWLEAWEQDQLINGFAVKSRPRIQEVIDKWPKTADQSLDLDRAPFRLLAIVNRIDLRNNFVLGMPRIGEGGAGEVRFVFRLIDENGNTLPFTAIFEYSVKRTSFPQVRKWGRKWYELKDLDPDSDEYLERLLSITEEVTGAGKDPERPPNRSCLTQLRTNEIALGNVWELREFRLDVDNTGYLKQVTVKQNPDLSFQGTLILQQYIDSAKDQIQNKRYSIPVEFPTGTPFLAGAAQMQSFFRWRLPVDAPTELEAALRQFAVHTCSGCHSQETNTQFMHIVARRESETSRLSNFLSDPTAGDLVFRAKDLRNLVEIGSEYEETRLPLQFVH